MDYTFSKREKLKSKKLIEKLFTEGKSVSKYPLKLIYVKADLNDEVKVQAGVSVSKRNFKRATDRNRIKRLIREAYRLNKNFIFNNIQTQYAFMFLYIGKQIPKNYDEINKNMIKLMQKFIDNEN
ncbi:ribonuclease P protein component [Abyssalbus ytuae]|uniref:Ribonuclease P protein component n=1 Tax=Abyssalbus ytuae TaxID=2926907 RepID=A0A9E7CV49_9FLAO|nr:ribonuclease P protein component [Abyssalbus ytuae]UOB19392.1 ribonuclease P protein component [Abyssalbus ytuae]